MQEISRVLNSNNLLLITFSFLSLYAFVEKFKTFQFSVPNGTDNGKYFYIKLQKLHLLLTELEDTCAQTHNLALPPPSQKVSESCDADFQLFLLIALMFLFYIYVENQIQWWSLQHSSISIFRVVNFIKPELNVFVSGSVDNRVRM